MEHPAARTERVVREHHVDGFGECVVRRASCVSHSSALLAESSDYHNIIPFANSFPATREELQDMMHMLAEFEADAGSRYR